MISAAANAQQLAPSIDAEKYHYEDSTTFSTLSVWLVGDVDDLRVKALQQHGVVKFKSVTPYKLLHNQSLSQLLIAQSSERPALLWIRLTGPKQQHDTRQQRLSQAVESLVLSQLQLSGRVALEGHRHNEAWLSPGVVQALQSGGLHIFRLPWCSLNVLHPDGSSPTNETQLAVS